MSHSWIPKLLHEMAPNLPGCTAEAKSFLTYLLVAGASLGSNSWLEILLVQLFISLQ